MVRQDFLGRFVGVCAALSLAACAAAPRERPLDTSPVATGKGTVEMARRVLDGQWTLISLNVTAQDKRSAAIEAVGVLTSDSFGNLNIEYRLSEAGFTALKSLGIVPPNPVISTNGQAAIDTQNRTITYIPPDAAARAFDPDLAAARANPFALERTRYYTLGEDGILTLSTRHDNGQEAAVSRWKKGS